MKLAITSLYHHLLTGIILLDENFVIIDINTALEQMLSTSRVQILQTQIFDILLPKISDETLSQAIGTQTIAKGIESQSLAFNQTLTQQFEHCRQLHQSFIYYNSLIHGVHSPLLVDYGVTPIEDSRGFFYVIELWTKDRQSRIEQEQQQHAQHQVTRQLIRSMAHEVKNPLAGILGASQLLQKKLDNQIWSSTGHAPPVNLDKIHTYLNIIMDETRRLNHLVNQLLGSPKLPVWQSLNIHEPLEHVLTLISLQPLSIKLVRDYDFSLPEIVADKDLLVQVFLNLINNAVQALCESAVQNPCITLRTRIVPQQTINNTRHKNVLGIWVTDNGPGIDAELLPTIFYPLVTGRAMGTGLGLALVHDIVERHAGLITVKSRKGRTEFQILLPFSVDKQP